MDPSIVAAHWEANAEAWTRHSRAGYDVYRDALNTPAFLAMLPPIDGLPYSCRVSRDPQIGYARAQVAALCTYPRGLLFGPGDAPDADGNLVKRSRSGFPDPAILGRYLAATHGRRLWEGYGCFRAPRAKETKPRRKRQSVRP